MSESETGREVKLLKSRPVMGCEPLGTVADGLRTAAVADAGAWFAFDWCDSWVCESGPILYWLEFFILVSCVVPVKF
jgi:hypothetical protein